MSGVNERWDRPDLAELIKLRAVLTEHGLFSNPTMRLLVFTEHKDTLDYLAGDGKDTRPKGKLPEWGLKVRPPSTSPPVSPRVPTASFPPRNAGDGSLRPSRIDANASRRFHAPEHRCMRKA